MPEKLKIKLYNLLRKSEKYTKTDMVYLAKGGFWLTSGQIVSSAAAFLLALAFANLLPKETFGTYKYVLSIMGILAIPTLGGMSVAITQATARGYEGSLVPALKTKIRWGLLGGLASLALAGYYYFNGNTTLTISFLITAVFLPFMDSFGIYNALLNGKKLFKVSTKYGVIIHIISVGTLIATLFLTKNLFFILLAYFIPFTLLRFIFFKITVKKIQPNDRRDPETISYGKHLSLINIIGTIANQIDKILVFHYLGAVELAIYIFAISTPQQIKNVTKKISLLALPKLSLRSREEIKKNIFKKIGKLFILLIPITLIYIISAPYIYRYIFPQYIDAVAYSQVFALTLLVSGGLTGTVLKSQKAIKEIYISNLFYSIFRILLIFVLIILYGIWGVIFAKVITITLMFLLNLILIKRLK